MIPLDKINTPDRPASVALTTAIEDCIYDIGTGELTLIEVLGCLDLVGKNFYDKHLREKEE